MTLSLTELMHLLKKETSYPEGTHSTAEWLLESSFVYHRAIQ